jgi:hypothetical protein
LRRDVRAVEGARLESVCTLTRTEGSNPSLSAILQFGDIQCSPKAPDKSGAFSILSSDCIQLCLLTSGVFYGTLLPKIP